MLIYLMVINEGAERNVKSLVNSIVTFYISARIEEIVVESAEKHFFIKYLLYQYFIKFYKIAEMSQQL